MKPVAGHFAYPFQMRPLLSQPMTDAGQRTHGQTHFCIVLNNWVAEYRENAKLALADKPQLLPKLGLALRASKTDAQRAAPKKAAETRKKNKEGGQ